jgi:hypothetical protein
VVRYRYTWVRSLLLAALVLTASHAARACSIAYTTIPDASGFVLCSGMNSDGTSMTWKVGGSITYRSFMGTHWQQGYKNVLTCPDGNPNIINSGERGNSVEGRLLIGSSVKPGIVLHLKLKLTWTQYPGTAQAANLAEADFTSPTAGSTIQIAVNFSDLSDVKDVQYKCVSWQVGRDATWTASTPYL